VAIGLVIAWVLLMAVRRLKTGHAAAVSTQPASTESPGGGTASMPSS
jgi:hypothetical protein